ncbi:hypothetical protein [Salinimicrobium xinjiangense]|uniref:hypothetical protein n=1 Tax=Salinimicrobium xinjiangense TaxID=438596 RepID=UPI000414F1CC|nr:hypothetical protein [Salinimicrobium xinjiangense]
MEHEKKNHSPSKKPAPDLVLETTDRDPHGNLFYHPSIFTFAVAGAIIGGLIMAFLAWMIADGSWAVVGLGQMSAGNRGPGAFFGFVVGSGVGGLLGAILGMRKMFRLSSRHRDENQNHQPEKS